MALALAFASCGPKALQKKNSVNLEGAVKLFNDDVRWGYADKASDFVEPAKRADFIAWRTKAYDRVQFTEVHVDKTTFDDAKTQADVIVTWKFYRKDQLTEQSKTATEHWSQTSLRWYVRFEPEAFP